MQKTKLSRKIIFCLAFYLGLAVAGAVLPLQIKALFKLKGQTAELERKVKAVEQEFSQQALLSKNNTMIKAQINRLEKKIISLQDSSTLSIQISQLARESGVEVLETAPGKTQGYKETADGKFQRVIIRLKAKGQYHALGRFFNRLENYDYFLEVKELILRSGLDGHIVDVTLEALAKG
jgi:Tfp pilus assembly protein PilO